MSVRILCTAAVTFFACLCAAGGASATNSATYGDPAGDTSKAADLTALTVSSDDAGTITFSLTYANRPSGLGDDDQVQIWFDSDENVSTGDQFGFDYVVALQKGGALAKHLTPTGLEDTPATTLVASADGRSVSINRSELGGTQKFEFFVRDLAKSDLSADEAPDESDKVFVYSLTGPRPTRIFAVLPKKPPKAGAAFSIAVPLVTFDDGNSTIPDKLGCNGTLNGKKFPGKAGVAHCLWKLPKSAKGKRLVLTITVFGPGGQATFGPWKFKVR